MKKKPWKIALIVFLSLVLLAGLGLLFLFLVTLDPGVFTGDTKLFYRPKIKELASMELVSQEKPLVFYEPMEQPPLEGVKVKLNYADGNSEVMDAIKMAGTHYYEGGFVMSHWKGVFFATSTLDQLSGPFETWEDFTMLPPGPHRIAMYYVDDTSWYETDPYFFFHNPDEKAPGRDWGRKLNFAYCMVDVYAQTEEEYLAEHNPE